MKRSDKVNGRHVSLLLLGLLALAGCGKGATSTSVSTSAPTTTAAPTTTGATTSNASTPATTPVAADPVKAHYEQRMQVLGNELSAYFLQIGRADATATKAEALANIKQVQARLRTASVELGKIKTPTKIKVDQQKLIAAVREYAKDLDQVIVQVKAGNKSALSELSELQGVKDMGTATQAITRAGYNITGEVTPAG
jgi:hypothetical protein